MHPACGEARFAGASAVGWIEAQSSTSRKYAGRIAPSLSRTPLHGSGSARSSGLATRFGLNSVTPTASPLPVSGRRGRGVGAGVGTGVAFATGAGGGTATVVAVHLDHDGGHQHARRNQITRHGEPRVHSPRGYPRHASETPKTVNASSSPPMNCSTFVL